MYLRVAKVGRKIEIFTIKFNENDKNESSIIKYKLLEQKEKVLKRLNNLKKKGLIKSINKPKAKDFRTKKRVKELVMANQILTKALRDI